MKIKLDEADLQTALELWVSENFNGFLLSDVTIAEKAVSIQVEKGLALSLPKVEADEYTKPDLGTIQRGGKAVGE